MTDGSEAHNTVVKLGVGGQEVFIKVVKQVGMEEEVRRIAIRPPDCLK